MLLNRKRINFTYLLLVIFISGCSNQSKSDSEQSSTTAFQASAPVVMAYYVPERDYKPDELPVEKLIHIIYSFTHVIDGEMKFRNPDEAGPKLDALVRKKERIPDLKVMTVCGGWGADGFSDMALTEVSRRRFIESAASFIENHKPYGMDMDWVYPGISGAGTNAREKDTRNFTALMKGLRDMLDRFDTPKLLTFTSAGWKSYAKKR